MPAAYVVLGNDGVVVRTHCTTLGGGAPTAGANDLETLINQGYQHVREVPLDGGRLLILLFRP